MGRRPTACYSTRNGWRWKEARPCVRTWSLRASRRGSGTGTGTGTGTAGGRCRHRARRARRVGRYRNTLWTCTVGALDFRALQGPSCYGPPANVQSSICVYRHSLASTRFGRIKALEFVYVLFASDLTGLTVQSVLFPSKRRV